jgi:hypothetical protein
MASSQQEEPLPSSPEHTLRPSISIDILPTSYLTVPIIRPSKRLPIRQAHNTTNSTLANALLLEEEQSDLEPLPCIFEPSPETTSTACSILPVSPPRPIPLSERLYMSVYSTSSVETDLSEFSNPPARSYRAPNSLKMSRKITVVRCASSMNNPGSGS